MEILFNLSFPEASEVCAVLHRLDADDLDQLTVVQRAHIEAAKVKLYSTIARNLEARTQRLNDKKAKE